MKRALKEFSITPSVLKILASTNIRMNVSIGKIRSCYKKTPITRLEVGTFGVFSMLRILDVISLQQKNV